MLLFTLIILFQSETVKDIKYFGNPKTPNTVFFQMVDIFKNDEYDLRKSKQLQQIFIRSGYYDKVTLLSIPKDNAYKLNYYFIEKEEYESYDYGLFLDVSQSVGIMLGYSWDFIKNTSIRFKSRLLYSSNLEDYKLSFYDNYAGYNIFYDFSFGFTETSYLFHDDIYSNHLNYEKRFMTSLIGYAFTNRHKSSLTFDRYAIKTNEEKYNNNLKEDFFFKSAIRYEYENLDWYLFPKDGYHLKMDLAHNSSDNNHDFQELRLQAKAYFNIFDQISLKAGYYNFTSTNNFPKIINDHFEENGNIFSFQDRFIGSNKHSYIFSEILLLSGLEYDPNLENDLMWLLGLESVSKINSSSTNKINQIFGINFSYILNRNIYKISITVNNKKSYNLNFSIKS